MADDQEPAARRRRLLEQSSGASAPTRTPPAVRGSTSLPSGGSADPDEAPVPIRWPKGGVARLVSGAPLPMPRTYAGAHPTGQYMHRQSAGGAAAGDQALHGPGGAAAGAAAGFHHSRMWSSGGAAAGAGAAGMASALQAAAAGSVRHGSRLPRAVSGVVGRPAAGVSPARAVGQPSPGRPQTATAQALMGPLALPPGHPPPLHNLGNSCFWNALLQCALACGEALRLPVPDAPARPEGALAAGVAVVRAWAGALARPHFGTAGGALAALRAWGAYLPPGQQADAAEALQALLCALRDGTSTITRVPPYVQLADGGRPEAAEAAAWWAAAAAREWSALDAVVAGQYRTATTCVTCGVTTRAYHTQAMLPLPLPPLGASGGGGAGPPTRAAPTRGASVPLVACLDSWAERPSPEWTCDTCGAQGGVVRHAVCRAPTLLLLHVQRFGATAAGRAAKLAQGLEIPHTLQLGRWGVGTSPRAGGSGGAPRAHASLGHTYALRGLLRHHGGLGGGHYTAVVSPVAAEGQWFFADDARVMEVTRPDGSPDGSAYVLWYLRRDGTDGKPGASAAAAAPAAAPAPPSSSTRPPAAAGQPAAAPPPAPRGALPGAPRPRPQ